MMKHLMMIPALLLSGTAFAAAPQPLSLTSDVKVERVTTVAGHSQTTLETPRRVVPGDHLVFSTAFHNTGALPAKHVVVLDRVPPGVAWSGEASDGIEASVDGGRTFGSLSSLRVPDGKGQRAARPDDVTHLRWTLAAVQPGQIGTLRYSGTVR